MVSYNLELTMTLLLASVRSPAEAEVALAGGADARPAQRPCRLVACHRLRGAAAAGARLSRLPPGAALGRARVAALGRGDGGGARGARSGEPAQQRHGDRRCGVRYRSGERL